MDESAATNARITEEISQRKKAEKKLRTSKGDLEARILDRTRALRTLTEANQTLVHAADEEQLLRDVCRVVVELGGYRMAWVGFAENDEEKSIRPVASAGDASGYLEQLKVSWGTGPTSQGPVGTSIRERKPMVARDTQNRLEPAVRMVEALPHGCESVIGLPLHDSEGAVFGVLAIYADKPDAFDAEEEALLSELAGDLAYGIGALRERDKRAAAEATVRGAASYARSIIEAAPDPLVAISPEGTIADVNTAAEEATGIPRGTLIGTDFASYLTEPDRARACFKKVLEEGLVRDFPLTLKRASGEVMDVLYSGTVYGNEAGEPQGVLVTARDVTEAKRAQAQVARLAAIVTSSQDAMFTKSLDDVVTSWNAAAEALYGYSAEEMIGADVEVLAPEEREGEPRQLLERVRQGERIAGFETQRKRKDGGLFDISLTLSPILDDAGDIVAVSVVGHDITERKRAEEALRESEMSLKKAQRLAGIGSWDWDTDTDTITWSEEYYRIYGIDPTQSPPRYEDHLKAYTPESAALLDAAVQKNIQTGEPYEIDLELARTGEAPHWITARSETKRDSQGRIIGLRGTAQDITERKHAEEALKGTAARLNEAQRISHLGSWELDVASNVLVWSDEIYQMFEIDPTEFDASYEAFLDAIHPEDREAVNSAYTNSLETKTPYAVEHRLLFPDGRIKYVHEECETEYDEEGSPIRSTGTVQDITERIEVEEALRLSEQRYRDIFDHSTDTLYLLEVTEDGRFRNLEVNAAFEASTGLSREQAIGKFQEDVVPQEQADIVNAKYRRCVEAGVPVDEETELELPSGRRFYYSSLIPLRDDNTGRIDRILGISRDITERRLAEEALRASQAKLALHLEQTLLGVIEWDTEFRAREWNPAATAIFGYSREEAIGRHAADLILPEAVRPQVESVWNQLLQQQGGQFNTNENVTKDGRTILCEWVNTPLTDAGGAVVGVMSLARDITERKQAEEFRIAKEAAEAANAAKSAFLTNMSHEIRTPMNAILGFSQLMRHDKGLSERQRQQLDTINSSGEHLLALINDVLEMSRIEAGRISANPTAFNLHSLLDEMDSLFSLRAEVKGLELRVVRSDELPRFVITDENKLRQVLVNLLGNAVKFTEEGSVELRVAVRRDEEGTLRLLAEVEDTGRGIAPEDIDRLFQYFEQAAAGRAAETGTGLGLAISREFVRLLGGETTVDSEVGAGSVFKFDIVIEEAEAGAARGGTEERRVEGLLPGEPHYRVLVADDAPDNRELLVQLLEPVGFSVRTVNDGKRALEEFESWRPQLILMDMRMPVMDGYEATRRIRSAHGGTDVAIIGVTASAFAEMRQGVFDAGVDEFIVKPFHEAELFDKIGKLLGVHYVYEEQAEEIEQGAADALDPAAIAALPSDLVSRIRQAAINADFDTVLELADEVGHHDDRSAAALRTLAERFDAERILAALPGGEDS